MIPSSPCGRCARTARPAMPTSGWFDSFDDLVYAPGHLGRPLEASTAVGLDSRISGALDLDLLPPHRVGDGTLAAADHRPADADHLGGHNLDTYDRPLLVQDHDERLHRLAGVATRRVEPRRGFALDLELLPADRHGDHHLLHDHAAAHPHPLGRAPYRVDG